MERRFANARDLFEQAREASRDAERIRRQLEDMERKAEGVGGGDFEPRVRTSPRRDRMEGRVVAKVDLEETLRQRQQEDYDLIDFACEVLYGTDNDAGLWSLVGWRADALCQHYVNDLTWEQVGALLGYSGNHCWREAQKALNACDVWGIPAAIRGRHGFQVETRRPS